MTSETVLTISRWINSVGVSEFENESRRIESRSREKFLAKDICIILKPSRLIESVTAAESDESPRDFEIVSRIVLEEFESELNGILDLTDDLFADLVDATI